MNDFSLSHLTASLRLTTAYSRLSLRFSLPTSTRTQTQSGQKLARPCSHLVAHAGQNRHRAPPGTTGRMASSRKCHAGRLLNLGCLVENGQSRRACVPCMDKYASGLQIPAARCRLLTEPYGTFGGGRNFFVTWSTPLGSIDGVRVLKLTGSTQVLLVFVEESMALHCEEGLPAGSAPLAVWFI